jgi:hypothetical protein
MQCGKVRFWKLNFIDARNGLRLCGPTVRPSRLTDLFRSNTPTPKFVPPTKASAGDYTSFIIVSQSLQHHGRNVRRVEFRTKEASMTKLKKLGVFIFGVVVGAGFSSANAGGYYYGGYSDAPYYDDYGPRYNENYYYVPQYYDGGWRYSDYYSRPYYSYPGSASYDDPIAYCMERFQSYDPRSGTYLGYDGFVHTCP